MKKHNEKNEAIFDGPHMLIDFEEKYTHKNYLSPKFDGLKAFFVYNCVNFHKKYTVQWLFDRHYVYQILIRKLQMKMSCIKKY